MHDLEQSTPAHPESTPLVIATLGVDHTTAPIGVREALAFSPADAVDFLKKSKQDGLATGGVVLSTCNRMEVTVESPLSATELRQALSRYLLEYRRLPQTYQKYLIYYDGEQAYEHLFRLVAGYESMVRGETQIVGQVKEALHLARTGGYVTKTLLRLYEKSLEVAKSIRSTEQVCAIDRSAGASAVDLLIERDGAETLRGATHLVVGAGLMAATLVESLKRIGAKYLTLYNRTKCRAQEFADKYGLKTYYADGDLETALTTAGYIWVATGASSPIILPGTLPASPSLTVFDLGLPRNVDPAVSVVDGVRLFCIDDLDRDTLVERMSDEAWNYMRQGIDEFRAWQEGLGIRDVYSIIRSETEGLLMRELQKAERHVDEATAKALTSYSHQISQRVSSDMISRLRKLSETTHDPIYATVLRELYTIV